MAAIKEIYSPKNIRAMAKELKRNHQEFSAEEFCRIVIPATKALELKDRVRLISRTLKQFLPDDFELALRIILNSTQSERNIDGLSGFQAWPFTQYIEDFGLNFPRSSLMALKKITQAMSAEFALRPFLVQDLEFCIPILQSWAEDKNAHVRRLVSEGTRPLLPWAQRLQSIQKDPEICIGLLRKLRHDNEIYVRKSVANHLNDISKNHPEWLVAELQHWKKEFPSDPKILWIIRHACRSLIKSGHPGALRLLGYKPPRLRNSVLKVSPKVLIFGKSLSLQFTAMAKRDESWLIDYAVHHKKSNGQLKAKVFKWTRKQMSRGETLLLSKLHRFVPISTREYYSGSHLIEVFVNGKSVAKTDFRLDLKK